LLDELIGVLNTVVLTDEEDRWIWKPDPNGGFSVKSTYEVVSIMLMGRREIDNQLASAFKSLWKCTAPSKVLGFSWLLLHSRLPTRDNLSRRHIISQEDSQLCVMCGVEAETPMHLFLYCKVALQVWEIVLNWTNLVFSLPQSVVSLLNFFAEFRGHKWRRQGLVLIWNAVNWTLWRQRNRIIFEEDTADITRLVDEIKVSSWRWWIARSKSTPCLLYEWEREPMLCMAG
jgi:hypothetical protein